MYSRIFLFILSLSFISAFGMNTYKISRGSPQPKVSAPKARWNETRARTDTRAIHVTSRELETQAKEFDYFSKHRALETRLNKYIDIAKDYNPSHKLLILAIESDPYVTWEDKQKLYDHYEEILHNKFKHTLEPEI